MECKSTGDESVAKYLSLGEAEALAADSGWGGRLILRPEILMTDPLLPLLPPILPSPTAEWTPPISSAMEPKSTE